MASELQVGDLVTWSVTEMLVPGLACQGIGVVAQVEPDGNGFIYVRIEKGIVWGFRPHELTRVDDPDAEVVALMKWAGATL